MGHLTGTRPYTTTEMRYTQFTLLADYLTIGSRVKLGKQSRRPYTRSARTRGSATCQSRATRLTLWYLRHQL